MPGVMLAQLAPLGSPPNRATAGILFPEEKTGKEKKTGQLSGSSGATPMAERQVRGRSAGKASGRKGGPRPLVLSGAAPG